MSCNIENVQIINNISKKHYQHRTTGNLYKIKLNSKIYYEKRSFSMAFYSLLKLSFKKAETSSLSGLFSEVGSLWLC